MVFGFLRSYFLLSSICTCALLGGGILSFTTTQARDLINTSNPTTLTPPSAPNRQQLRELLLQGQKYVDRGDFSRAIAVYQQAATLDQNNAKIFGGMGYLYVHQGRYDEAIQAYQKALSLDPNSPEFYDGLAVSYASFGNNNNAITAYAAAIELEPNSPK